MSEAKPARNYAILGATGSIGSGLTRRSIDGTDFRAVEEWIAGVGGLSTVRPR